MVIFNIILYITIGFIVYFGYQTVLHYHKHENVNFLRGLIISTLVLAVLVSLQIYWALPNIIGLFLWLTATDPVIKVVFTSGLSG